MRDVNKVILIGRLGADPVQRETKNGLAVTAFSVATTWRGKQEGESRTQWHKVVAWGKQAESCAAYLRKGNSVYVEGTMKSRKYEDKDGETRTSFEVHADAVSFLGGKGHAAKEVSEAEADIQEASA